MNTILTIADTACESSFPVTAHQANTAPVIIVSQSLPDNSLSILTLLAYNFFAHFVQVFNQNIYSRGDFFKVMENLFPLILCHIFLLNCSLPILSCAI